ncbi:hypothetical protein BDY19DRAFT_263298 [Irpex rosettiformis]|uniref:Uncharacterized protein n=1 Tax=Irpex rosettiformis TaxID=378272 RepID=A0ACB8UH47_9APHY|nr:hypothetical protein BDY19DRAFT_263298 [Irpex rosettiformis]
MATRPLTKLLQHPPFPTYERPAQVSVVFDGSLNPRLADTLPDVIIRSSDNVYFAVHRGQILFTSTNRFSALLSPSPRCTAARPSAFTVPEPSDVLSDLFHTVYGLACDLHWPSLESIQATLDALKKYGMLPLEAHVFQDTFLYHAIHRQSRVFPLEAYTLAAENHLEDVAVTTSAETIHSRIIDLDMTLACRMGVMYLSRLHRLHDMRREGLKQLFLVRMTGHAETPDCDLDQQRETYIDLQLGCKALFMMEPALYVGDLEVELNEFRSQVTCPDCNVIVSAEIARIIADFKRLEKTAI